MTGVDLPEPELLAVQIQAWRDSHPDLDAMLDRHREPLLALRQFGLARWGAGQPDLAAAAFVAALSHSPDSAAVWRDASGAYLAAGDMARAEFCVRRSLELDPAHARAWVNLADLRNKAGDLAEAETMYRKAIGRDDTLVNAYFGLGILQVGQQRPAEAARSFRDVVRHDPAHMLALSCLGHVLYMIGEFADSATAFESALRLASADDNTRRKFARARTMQTMIEGDVERALRDYAGLAGSLAENLDVIQRDAQSLLAGYGHVQAAAAVGRISVARHPEDPVRRYLLDAATGAKLTGAPAAYIEQYFDQFADEFDHKLVQVLRYHVPDDLQALIARHRSRFDAMVDLGCGTGLAGPQLARFGGSLVGVDLSGRMLAQAERRGSYASVTKASAVTFLEENVGRFDLAFAADLLIYLGDLAPLFAAIAHAVRPGGLWAFSVESAAPDEDYRLQPTGRFTHGVEYLDRLAGSGFTLLEDVSTIIRLEADRPVQGRLRVLRRNA